MYDSKYTKEYSHKMEVEKKNKRTNLIAVAIIIVNIFILMTYTGAKSEAMSNYERTRDKYRWELRELEKALETLEE